MEFGKKKKTICLEKEHVKKKFEQRVTPAKKIPAQAMGVKTNLCKPKIPHPLAITFLMVRP